MRTLSPFILYLIKVIVLYALVYIIYITLLSKLTFYRLSRFFLLGATVFCFTGPLINISCLLKEHTESGYSVVYHINDWQQLVTGSHPAEVPLQAAVPPVNWQLWILITIAGGVLVGGIRFMLQLHSLYRIARCARLLKVDRGAKLYVVEKLVAPFSFGNRVFISLAATTDAAMQEILAHEMTHVQQKHTIDICVAKLAVIFQWFNPFAWLLQQAIRQNLEFMADEAVLHMGADKKHYQYHLLHVTGNSPLTLVNRFNFSSLKKRISMMNTHPSPGKKLLRLLLLIPVTAVVLLAFRKPAFAGTAGDKAVMAGLVLDAQTLQPVQGAVVTAGAVAVKTDGKGYYKIELPYTSLPLNMQYTIQEPAHRESTGSFSISSKNGEVAGIVLLFGIDNKEGGQHAFNSLYSPQNATSFEYASIATLYEKVKKDRLQGNTLHAAMQGNEKIYLEVNGYSYVTAATGGSATVYEPASIVVVNGKQMTGDEINARYKRSEVTEVSADSRDSVVKKYGRGILGIKLGQPSKQE